MSIGRLLTLFLPLAAMLIGLPLLGVALSGRPIAPYLEFPPTTTRVTHAPFSWWVFWALAVPVGLVLTRLVYAVAHASTPIRSTPVTTRALPWWGWLGVVITAIAWGLAWTRLSWFQPFQEYTFTPLWMGYIVTMNALSWRRTGHCLLTDRPGHLVALFALSACFWWSFEYLNRFAQNWHYVGVAELGPWEYFWQATLPFSTVLPAVLSTRELLASVFDRSHLCFRGWVIRPARPRRVAWAALCCAALGLYGIGVRPEQLYPALWLAPLLALLSLQALRGEATVLDAIADGDWSRLAEAALAALLCGFFWELWNYKSLAHWEYSVPYVHRFEIFHMPALGYAGYLPFGAECLAAASLLDNSRYARQPSTLPAHGGCRGPAGTTHQAGISGATGTAARPGASKR